MASQLLKKLPPALKEVRIHLCPRSSNSNGIRSFIEKYYSGLKESNPNLPILVRECTGVEPKIWFRFEYGQETSAKLINMDADQIAALVKDKTTSQ